MKRGMKVRDLIKQLQETNQDATVVFQALKNKPQWGDNTDRYLIDDDATFRFITPSSISSEEFEITITEFDY